MATQSAYQIEPGFVTVEEYLHTVYEPECDYVDGRIEERSVGEYDHGLLQLWLGALFMKHRDEWRIRVVTDVRAQVKFTRFRCPDVLVLRADAPREQILTHPPLIGIEILSPEDRLSRFRVKIEDYIAFGIQNILESDPIGRRHLRRGGYRPTTITVKLPGSTGGRGRGISGVGAGRGPNSAATK